MSLRALKQFKQKEFNNQIPDPRSRFCEQEI